VLSVIAYSVLVASLAAVCLQKTVSNNGASAMAEVGSGNDQFLVSVARTEQAPPPSLGIRGDCADWDSQGRFGWSSNQRGAGRGVTQEQTRRQTHTTNPSGRRRRTTACLDHRESLQKTWPSIQAVLCVETDILVSRRPSISEATIKDGTVSTSNHGVGMTGHADIVAPNDLHGLTAVPWLGSIACKGAFEEQTHHFD